MRLLAASLSRTFDVPVSYQDAKGARKVVRRPSRDPILVAKALRDLQRLIHQGVEYPDAHTAVCTRHHVDGELVAEAYDDACCN